MQESLNGGFYEGPHQAKRHRGSKDSHDQVYEENLTKFKGREQPALLSAATSEPTRDRPVRRPARWPQPHLTAGSAVRRTSATRAGPDALPHASERPDGVGLPQVQEDQACEHQG
ncbi:unnamed protein product [Leptidea sinapis]|uniref:Uncharacterized protein n=1 Tax=Leptidea sinapis TaxID=189913 RepID=A0A5E4QP40_9NEOP|nr:unnamed protein product [Leptidea sinapis]